MQYKMVEVKWREGVWRFCKHGERIESVMQQRGRLSNFKNGRVLYKTGFCKQRNTVIKGIFD
jgi:hypothetical protein